MTINKPNNTDTQARKFKLAPDYAGTEHRVTHDFEQCDQLMRLFDKERGIEENPLLTSSEWEPLSVCFFLVYLFFFSSLSFCSSTSC